MLVRRRWKAPTRAKVDNAIELSLSLTSLGQNEVCGTPSQLAVGFVIRKHLVGSKPRLGLKHVLRDSLSTFEKIK
jgi:hypothetical protein